MIIYKDGFYVIVETGEKYKKWKDADLNETYEKPKFYKKENFLATTIKDLPDVWRKL